jgi:chemotaxis protein MotA
MDFATVIGLVFGGGLIYFLVHEGGGFERYVNEHAAIVVFGGAIAATFIRFELSSVLTSFPLGMKLVLKRVPSNPRALVAKIADLAALVRKSGPMALEKVQVDDPFLAKGLRYVADGYDAEFIRDTLERERDLNLHRLETAQKIYRSIGDCAPAFGMVGTLIGMVQMFAEMSDPAKLGPFMAIALLATLYGAVLQNFIFNPIADKLQLKFGEDEMNPTLVIDGVLQLRESKSPALIKEMLLSYLPEKHREVFAEAA